jgi:hypothetical protein
MKPMYVLAALALAACSPSTPTTASSSAAPSSSPGASSAPAAAASGGTFEVTVNGTPLTFTTPPTATLRNADVFMDFSRGSEGSGAYANIELQHNARFKTPVVLPPASNGTERQAHVSNGVLEYWADRSGSHTDEDKLVIEGGHLKGTWSYHSYQWVGMSPSAMTRNDVVITIDMALPAGLQ